MEDVFPIKHGGYSIAMLVYQRVNGVKWCPYKWPGFFIFFGYTPTYRGCCTSFITGSGAHLGEILGIFAGQMFFAKQILGT